PRLSPARAVLLTLLPQRKHFRLVRAVSPLRVGVSAGAHREAFYASYAARSCWEKSHNAEEAQISFLPCGLPHARHFRKETEDEERDTLLLFAARSRRKRQRDHELQTSSVHNHAAPISSEYPL